METLLDL